MSCRTGIALQLSRYTGVAFFGLYFRNVALESRYTPESVLNRPLSHPLLGSYVGGLEGKGVIAS